MAILTTDDISCACYRKECDYSCETYRKRFPPNQKPEPQCGNDLIQHVGYTPEQMGYDK